MFIRQAPAHLEVQIGELGGFGQTGRISSALQQSADFEVDAVSKLWRFSSLNQTIKTLRPVIAYRSLCWECLSS
jgi:hypothetical protein